MHSVIRTEHVGRTYSVKRNKSERTRGGAKTLVALEDVSIEIEQGELFGLLGPNGAGKTTLIKVLTTLLTPTSGRAWVSGLDVVKEAQKVRQLINMVSGGETSGYGILTVRENLWMFSQFYGIDSKVANKRIEELLSIVEMSDKANARISGLSTGERQRMNFCRGFVTDPTVLFLDEPTLGLDVNAAIIVRTFTRKWMEERSGRTVLLTTHYMAEADQMCDRIAIVDRGKVLACDTPENLKRSLQKDPIFRITSRSFPAEKLEQLRLLPGVQRLTSEGLEGGMEYALDFILSSEDVLGSLLNELSRIGGNIITLEKHQPTLEDVFLKLVGRGLKQENVSIA